MLEALVSAGPVVKIHDTAIPTPGPKQILTRVIVSGSNPKDWKRPMWDPTHCANTNQGDDIAGMHLPSSSAILPTHSLAQALSKRSAIKSPSSRPATE